MFYTVKQVAEIAGVTVRLLHHYDRIGLLVPYKVPLTSYRQYSTADIERLQQILLLRETGMGLSDIKAAMEQAGFDRKDALLEHRRALSTKASSIERLIKLIDRSIGAMEEGRDVDLKELFDGFDPAGYEQEARAKYREKYEETKRRTSRYSRQDWEEMKKESSAIMTAIADSMPNGPFHPDVTVLIGRHRAHITRWFYDCTPEIYAGLSELYVQDDRFAETYERIKPGLAKFMSEAMKHYLSGLKGEV